MAAKIRFFSLTLILLNLFSFKLASAFELECGVYEIIGRYDSENQILWVYESTNARMPLSLFGKATLTGFLPGSTNHYRVKVAVNKKIPNRGGSAKLLEVIGIAQYHPKELQFKKLSAAHCR
ncbi:MAG TPA: hypothetical protein DCS07_06990 [Bdellovibrionales bacterium]|nr:MAG: hypothetical protein A2Z97_12120 [Bdellovibrionales bacterium GWB1_52_6]OFZ06022.1 MAG: hypothetical protein A2X97_01655 [Bdellovibrionales bacterium GWA1_52_35]OFZ39854.1 MAG: hypothetical protein A2070_03360 [Bdellovibrionales bacterium GWC1_52_8]HAR42364.1 hypothetical protein [Bdellovibrionales bacterium]HCM39353.1 hypothetical protein [Bdellovibrionales bacterium]